ncbi:hypothetical protein HDU92_004083, partial [Lobulomyces angularis]
KPHIKCKQVYSFWLTFFVNCQTSNISNSKFCLPTTAHLLKNNAGVLRGTHREQKSRVEQKGKSSLDFDFQCEYKP